MTDAVERSLRVLSKGVFAAFDLFAGDWPGPRILIYHQIIPEPVREMDLSPEAFAKQIRWLAGHGRVVDLAAALDHPERNGANRDFVLTFDDGHSGLYEYAFPILRNQQMPFTLYVTSHLVEDVSAEDSLDWDQVNEMQDSGLLTIGAHTHTHPDLRGLSVDRIEEEIETSNELIERRTGVVPKHFAYTKGYWAEAAEPIVERHYETAALGAGPPIDNRTDRYRLSRLPVQRSDGYFFFKRKMARGMRLEEWFRSRIKSYHNPTSVRSGVTGDH